MVVTAEVLAEITVVAVGVLTEVVTEAVARQEEDHPVLNNRRTIIILSTNCSYVISPCDTNSNKVSILVIYRYALKTKRVKIILSSLAKLLIAFTAIYKLISLLTYLSASFSQIIS